MNSSDKSLSKFLALVLRHKPETIGIQLDASGWVAVDTLLAACSSHGQELSREKLFFIVETNDKQRFALSPNKDRIRANQGHSIEIDLGYREQTPPAFLYHGTATRFIDSIKAQGLLKGKRHHVHLTTDKDIALNVGSRYGHPVLLIIDSATMHCHGCHFFLSQNGVWLTEHVPARYIRFHP